MAMKKLGCFSNILAKNKIRHLKCNVPKLVVAYAYFSKWASIIFLVQSFNLAFNIMRYMKQDYLNFWSMFISKWCKPHTIRRTSWFNYLTLAESTFTTNLLIPFL